MRRSESGLVALGLLLAVAPALGGEPMKGGVAYRVTIDSDLKLIPTDSPAMRMRNIAEFDYRLGRRADRVEVAVDRMLVSSTVDDGLTSLIEMNRSGIVGLHRGRHSRLNREGGSPDLLERLDAFEAPLAVLAVDSEGAEVRRELRIETGPLIDYDLIDIARIFHPRFAKDLPDWDAKAFFTLDTGQRARGALHYAKRSGKRPDGRIEVDVTGKLEATGKMIRAEIKKGTCTVKGVQTYDPALSDWVGGSLAVGIDFEGVALDGKPYRVRGPVVMTLGRRGPVGPKARPEAAP